MDFHFHRVLCTDQSFSSQWIDAGLIKIKARQSQFSSSSHRLQCCPFSYCFSSQMFSIFQLVFRFPLCHIFFWLWGLKQLIYFKTWLADLRWIFTRGKTYFIFDAKSSRDLILVERMFHKTMTEINKRRTTSDRNVSRYCAQSFFVCSKCHLIPLMIYYNVDVDFLSKEWMNKNHFPNYLKLKFIEYSVRFFEKTCRRMNDIVMFELAFNSKSLLKF